MLKGEAMGCARIPYFSAFPLRGTNQATGELSSPRLCHVRYHYRRPIYTATEGGSNGSDARFQGNHSCAVKRDPGFPKTLLREGVENFLSGDSETGNILLRDFIGAGLVEKITTRQIKGPSK